MKRYLFLLTVTFVTLFLMPASSQGDQIVFTHEGIGGSGTIDGEFFEKVDFTIVAVGNTDEITDFGSGFFLDHESVTIDLDGIGTFDFQVPTRTFVNNGSEVVGFSRGGDVGLDLFNGPFAGDFAKWDLTTSIGPVSGDATLLQWADGNTPVVTSGGTLVFDSQSVPSTFTAVVGAIPEPSSAIVLIAMGCCLSARRRR